MSISAHHPLFRHHQLHYRLLLHLHHPRDTLYCEGFDIRGIRNHRTSYTEFRICDSYKLVSCSAKLKQKIASNYTKRRYLRMIYHPLTRQI